MIRDMTTITTTRITERGQISIPASLRESLGLRSGTTVSWRIADDGRGLLGVPVALPTARARSARDVVGWGRKYHAPRRPAEWMAELREGEVP